MDRSETKNEGDISNQKLPAPSECSLDGTVLSNKIEEANTICEQLCTPGFEKGVVHSSSPNLCGTSPAMNILKKYTLRRPLSLFPIEEDLNEDIFVTMSETRDNGVGSKSPSSKSVSLMLYADNEKNLTITYADEAEMEEDEKSVLASKEDECSMRFLNKIRKANELEVLEEVPEIEDLPEGNFIPLGAVKLTKDQRSEDRLVEIAPTEKKEDVLGPVLPEEILSEKPMGKGLKVFISDNPDENRDNNNPVWTKFKNLKDDKERFKTVHEHWQNRTIPNPNDNLTSFNWRVIQGLPPIRRVLRKRFLPCTQKNNFHVSSGTCQEVFNYARREAVFAFDKTINQIRAHYQNCLRTLSEKQASEERELLNSRGWNLRREEHLINCHRNEWNQLCAEWTKEVTEMEQGYRLCMQNLDSASQDVENTYYYYGNRNQVLTEEEIKQWIEVEDMVSSYDYFYQ